MTRGGEEDIEWGLRKFVDTRKGGSEKIKRGSENLYTLNPNGGGGGGGAPKKIEPLAKGATKISSFEFQYLHPPPLSY